MWHFDASFSNLVCLGETGSLLKSAMQSAAKAAHETRRTDAIKKQRLTKRERPTDTEDADAAEDADGVVKKPR